MSKETSKNEERAVLFEGKFIRFIEQNGWEYFERNNCTGIVIIVALTDEDKVIFVEQHRLPVGCPVIEFPAGLINDREMVQEESLEEAAIRELFEETGYHAESVERLLVGPVSAGATSDLVTMVRASGLQKKGDGGGDETEQIKVHEIDLGDARKWLAQKEEEGYLIEPKIFAGLYFLGSAGK